MCLQTSIAQFLAKKQLERSNSQDNKPDAGKSEKPTASVQPVQNRDLADQSSAVIDPAKTVDIKTKTSNNISANDQTVQNGPVVSSGDNSVNNGCLDLNKGAVSLLNPVCSSSINGDIEMAEVIGKSKSDSNTSQESSPLSNVVKVTWPSGDKQTSTVSSTSQTGNRNIVISTVNKTNNVYTRVVPGIPNKVQGQTSILSPRAANQTGKLGSSVLKSNVAAASGSTTTTKVITVNQPVSQTGKKYNYRSLFDMKSQESSSPEYRKQDLDTQFQQNY